VLINDDLFGKPKPEYKPAQVGFDTLMIVKLKFLNAQNSHLQAIGQRNRCYQLKRPKVTHKDTPSLSGVCSADSALLRSGKKKPDPLRTRL